MPASKKRNRYTPQKKPSSNLTAEGYKARFITGGNASHARYLHYCRLAKRDAK